MSIAAIDAKTGADRLLLSCVEQRYSLDDSRVATLRDLPGRQVLAPAAIVTTPRGELVRFDDGQTGLSPYGAYLDEPGATNLCSANNASPTDATAVGRWIHGAGNPNPVKFARVTPQTVGATALRDVMHHETGAYIFRALVDNGTISGDVVEVFNSDYAATLTARPAATINTLVQNVFSTYAMIVDPGNGADATTPNPRIGFTDSGGYNAFSNAYWDRVYRISVPGPAGGGSCVFQIPPRCRVWFILWQCETGGLPTNPIVCGDAATPAAVRTERSFAMTGLSRQLTLPFTAQAEMWLSNVDNVTRDLFSLTASGSANRILVTREWSNDNSLKLRVSNGAYTPVFRKLSGAGSIRTAVLVDKEVSRFSFAGLTKIDPFTAMPADLDTIAIGSAGVWLREFRIVEKTRGDALEAMTAPGDDAVISDTARYVSAAGDDNADGKTPQTAWRTTDKVKAQFAGKVIGAGMHILFRRGDRGFAGFQVPLDDADGNPVLQLADVCVYGAYGEGARPRFDLGEPYGFYAHGIDYAQWDGLEIANFTGRPIELFAANGPMITDCVMGPGNPASTDPNQSGLCIRGASYKRPASGVKNAYMAGNIFTGITAPQPHGAGDDILIWNMGGKIIYRGGHLGAAVGPAADGIQLDSCFEADFDAQYVYIDAPESGKGGMAIQAGSFTLRDFDINGTNFCITSSSSNTLIERGVVRGARLNNYSAGFSWDGGTVTNPDNTVTKLSVNNCQLTDVDIYDCSRGVSLSTAGPDDVTYRTNIFATRVRVIGCDTGLQVDLRSSGDLSQVEYIDCVRSRTIAARVTNNPVPPGGVNYFKY